MRRDRSRSDRAIEHMVFWLLFMGSAVSGGCSRPPQVGMNNYELVAGLRTAISARRTDWLESAAAVAAERHAAGKLNDEQFASLEAIVAQARDGKWTDAENEVLRLAKAQMPSSDEIEQSKAKKKSSRQ